jgi:chromosome segregation ATPase
MYRGVVAFITLQLIALVIVGLYPPLVNYLPNRSSLLSEAAPPPRNPRLQFCLDQFVTDAIAADQGATLAAINAAKTINIDGMPKFIGKSIEGSTESAEKSLAALAGIQTTSSAVKDAEAGYRPQLTLVRGLEKQIRNIAEHRDELAKRASRMNADNPKRPELEAEVAHLSDEIAALETQIPDSWEAAHETFKKLTDAETKARNAYRRAGDTAWEDAAVVLATLDATPAFIALEGELNALRPILETADFEVAEDAAKALERRFRDVEGADDVKKALGKAKKAMSKRKKDRETALEQYEKALVAYADQLVWRDAAETQIRPGVAAYLEAIKGNIGTRAQEDLTREQALFLATCTSHHKDLSLNF